MQGEAFELVADGDVRTRQEARAHPVGSRAQPEVEARRLDLVVVEGPGGRQPTRRVEGSDVPVGQNARPPLRHRPSIPSLCKPRCSAQQ